MGCFNGSCFFSGLPILEGDPAVAVPVVSAPNGQLSVTWFPIHGEYNDYGSLENIKETSLTKKLVELVNAKGSHNAVPGPHAIKFGSQWRFALEEGDIETIEDLVKVMERQGCRDETLMVYDGYQGGWSGISILLVHGAVWSFLREQNPMAGSYFQEKLEGMRASIDGLRPIVGRGFSDIIGSYSCTVAPYEELFTHELFHDGELDAVKEDALHDILTFWRSADALRHPLNADAGGGSQHDGTDFVLKMARNTMAICEARIAARDEDYCAEDTDE